MKTTHLVLLALCLFFFNAKTYSQATQSVNAINSTSYLGTSNNNNVIFKRQDIPSGLISTTNTSFGLYSLAMPSSVSFGISAGQYSSGTGFNTYIGQNAGKGTSSTYLNSGTYNTYVGYNSGAKNLADSFNTAFGAQAFSNGKGNNNVSVGFEAGANNNSTSDNILVGYQAGKNNQGAKNLFIGSKAGINTEGDNNIFLGYNTALVSTNSSSNIFIGNNAGKTFDIADNNVLIGHDTGSSLSYGSANVFLGNSTGQASTTGSYNTYLGSYAGLNNNGSSNVLIGMAACQENSNGNDNVAIGNLSGFDSNGSRNVFIGNQSGYESSGDDKLFIENSSSSNPLIWGDFANDQLKFNGKVGIGGNSISGFGSYPTTAGSVNVSSYNLFVKGGILTEEIRVSTNSTWADYVFNKDYNLKPLFEVEKFIKENGHLPNVPSAAKVKEEGIELGEMAKIQQEKIEELTLYIIELNKKLEAQEKRMQSLEAKINN